ncbi:MAG: hypothetical protein SFV52_11445 [Saprospiraceae bacterium]|nr:hypothetical protein [Saprospiraceae bacterium]
MLLFVYNADTGFFNLAADIAHKVFSPSTYPCRLCDLTHGVWRIRPDWEAFVRTSPVPMTFLHRDEFQAQYPQWKSTALPAVFLASPDGVLTLHLTADQLNAIHNLTALTDILADSVHLYK